MKVIGHRGAKGLAPENTAKGLKKALEYGVDGVEFDLRVTKDGVPILNHDPYITTANGHKFLITHHDYAELKGQSPNLATFEEAMMTVHKRAVLYIEVKPHVAAEPIVRIIKKYTGNGWSESDFRLCSFSQKTLRALHQAMPNIQTVVIERWSGIRAIRRTKDVGTDMLSMDQLFLWSGFIKYIRRRGLKLYAYPLNSPTKAARWSKHGLAGVITDFPDRFNDR